MIAANYVIILCDRLLLNINGIYDMIIAVIFFRAVTSDH